MRLAEVLNKYSETGLKTPDRPVSQIMRLADQEAPGRLTVIETGLTFGEGKIRLREQTVDEGELGGTPAPNYLHKLRQTEGLGLS